MALDDPPVTHAELVSTLSPDEKERASRQRHERDRRHMEAARGLLRRLLGAYTGTPAAQLEFALGERGKPRLHQPSTLGIEFNLSHSGGYALLGIAAGHALGVDLELVRPVDDLEQIARSNFAAAEVRELLDLEPERRLAGFIAGWTRKEAFVKAQGHGLAMGLGGFEVSMDPDGEAELRGVDGSSALARHWTLWGFKATADTWAAAAVHVGGARLRRFSLMRCGAKAAA